MTPIALSLYSFGLEKQTRLITSVGCSETDIRCVCVWGGYPHVFTVNPRARIHGRITTISNFKVNAGCGLMWGSKKPTFSVQMTTRTLISIYTNTLQVCKVSGLSSRFLWWDSNYCWVSRQSSESSYNTLPHWNKGEDTQISKCVNEHKFAKFIFDQLRFPVLNSRLFVSHSGTVW